jgi:hypothetical protein
VTVHRCRLTAGADAARPVALVSVADIAKAAQIGKGTVYLYWRTKEELIADVMPFARSGSAGPCSAVRWIDRLFGRSRSPMYRPSGC